MQFAVRSMCKITWNRFLIFYIFLTGCGETTTYVSPILEADYELVFEENFDGFLVDSTKWLTRTNNPKPFDRVLPRVSCNFENAEIILDENINVQNGYLNLIAKNEEYLYRGIAGGANGIEIGCDFIGGEEFELPLAYTSASVTAKAGFSHAYFECRAKIPAAMGLYPVFWLWHHDEIVVFEFFGNPKEHFLSAHNKEKFSTQKFTEVNNYSDKFHIYAVNWTSLKIVWYFDHKPIKTEYKYVDNVTQQGVLAFDEKNVENYSLNPAFPDSKDRWLSPNFSLRIFEWASQIENEKFPDSLIVDYLKIYKRKE